jgi:hypothetical protein
MMLLVYRSIQEGNVQRTMDPVEHGCVQHIHAPELDEHPVEWW